MKDVYKIYNFVFDKEKAIEGLRQALIDKGIDNKHKFVDYILRFYPDKSKSTLEEYYTRRLCNDNEILKLLHDELKINLQEAFLPNSNCKHKIIINTPDISSYYIQFLDEINIVLYNSNELDSKSSSDKFEEYYDSLDTLINIYCYYNYLIQKHINSHLSNREKDMLDFFVNLPLTSTKTIYQFVDENKGKNNIFNLYYKNNTLCLFEGKKHYLLDYIKMFDIVPEEKLPDLLCLITPKEKNILYTIYKSLKNEKMINALMQFNVKELNNIEIVNNNVFDTLNLLIDKEVL